MRVLITGATGVIGRRVVPLLLREGHEVTALVHAPGRGADLARIGATVREMSLFDPDLTEEFVGHHVVVNLATHLPTSMARMFVPGAWHENDRIRSDGSANIVAASLAGGVQRLIQESFAPIYLGQGDAWLDETSPVEPGHYNRSVLDAERSARRFAKSGRTSVVLRFAAFYGPDAFQLGAMLRFMRHGWAPLPGAPESYFSSVSHDDAAAAVVMSLGVPSGIYNVGDDQPMSHRDFADALADAAGLAHPNLPPAWMTPLGGSLAEIMARSLRISNQKLKAASTWEPRYPSVREGFPAALAAESPLHH